MKYMIWFGVIFAFMIISGLVAGQDALAYSEKSYPYRLLMIVNNSCTSSLVTSKRDVVFIVSPLTIYTATPSLKKTTYQY